jgi:uncharacterized membrane protein
MNVDLEVITYSDIDLRKTEFLLKNQGILLVDLGWFRARTMIALINEEKKLQTYQFARIGLTRRTLIVLYDIVRLVPLVLFSSKLGELLCIYVNNCTHVEWERLHDGKFRFAFL